MNLDKSDRLIVFILSAAIAVVLGGVWLIFGPTTALIISAIIAAATLFTLIKP